MNVVGASIAQVDDDVARSLGIHILDYPMLVNGEQVEARVADWPTIHHERRELIKNRDNRCTTSSLSEAILLETYERLKHEPFLSMHQGERFSAATWAVLRKIEREHPEYPCTLVDAQHTLSGYTVLLLQAARALAGGETWESYRERFERARDNTTNIAAVYDLFYLSRTGRVSFAKALLGTALRTIPMLIYRNGMDGVRPLARARTYAQANLRMVQSIESDLRRVGGDRVDVVIAWFGPRDDEREHLLSLIEARGWNARIDQFIGKYSAAAHLGPDYWEIGYTVHAD
ncbi:DegV family protein [Paraliomyxa miuraensis]|nr:DegV family protein [Paraliomyxa miuraensis]